MVADLFSSLNDFEDFTAKKKNKNIPVLPMWGFPIFFIPLKFEKFQLCCQFNGKTLHLFPMSADTER